ncbi:PadR family transcriptional regulator [Streptococcus saliviloxodontae]|uniref:DNA-binding PadR family transcriptional regulator n=1 Tax=Streptococcus saliviloxodontae TaxID=1349416 RepID=A0ABS2PKQ3_9STRE|nr:PadR family transcriptional regulator [Streptococcus saliviloxodontae]MBM7635936.1 DNA-binding PadR family transcriptional regulator [Streptococcus saliviloxodontae]
MDKKIERVYVPMTESAFYILFALQEERHGYDITQVTKELTAGQVVISPGTMYGTLSKMEKDGLIVLVGEEGKRKLYRLTALGREVLDLELARIERLYRNSKGERYGNENRS